MLTSRGSGEAKSATVGQHVPKTAVARGGNLSLPEEFSPVMLLMLFDWVSLVGIDTRRYWS